MELAQGVIYPGGTDTEPPVDPLTLNRLVKLIAMYRPVQQEAHEK
jgi:hypothetical protein